MSYEHRETNGTRFGGVYKEYLKIDREHVLRCKEPYLNKTKMIVGHPMKR